MIHIPCILQLFRYAKNANLNQLSTFLGQPKSNSSKALSLPDEYKGDVASKNLQGKKHNASDYPSG
jgi:hypothetical protein